MSRVLFSPIGGTDPIRYLYDGSMLHICRHYQPDKVILYLSSEMVEKHREDNRYVRTLNMLGDSIGHTFDIKVIENEELIDVQKYDVYYEIFRQEIKNISDNLSSGDELIVNMASGTPAMKSALLILATLSEYKFIPIQVNSPQKKMNSEIEDRNNYDVELNWELNQDNLPDSENRCEEVKCMNLIKLLKIDLIKKFIRKYDYSAAFELGKELKDDISVDAYNMLEIANNRLKLNYKEISKITSNNKYDIYPIKDAGNMKLFEYACVLEIKLKKEEYSDFIRGITPLIVDIFEQILKTKMNINVELLCDIRNGVNIWNIGKLKNNDIFDILNNSYIKKGWIKEGPVYSHALAHIIRAKSNDNILKSKVDEIVNVEQNIRNLAAHQIVSVTDKWFVDKSGKSPEEIMNIIRYLLVQAGVGVKKEDWDTYDVMNDKIVRYLE